MSDTNTIVGVIGLGAIGEGVSALLINGGYTVRGYDLRPEALTHHEDLGGVASGSPAELADGADCVLIAVFDDAQLIDVLEGKQGVYSAAKPAPVFAVLSTVTAETVRHVYAASAERGIAALDCGVSGGTEIREHRPIAASVGGDMAAFESVKDVLETFGQPTVYMGSSGTGMMGKIARNMLYYCSTLADFEALRLATAAGLDLEAFKRFAQAADDKAGGRMKYGLDGDPHSHARLAEYAAKDLEAAMKLAGEVSVELPEATLATRIFTEVVTRAGNVG